MPVSEAQKRANKAWREKNRERWNELHRESYKRWKANNPESAEICRKRSREHYWKNREAILERARVAYLIKTGQAPEQEPTTDTETVISEITDMNDWTTVNTAEETIEPEPEPIVEHTVSPAPPKYIHPLFGKI